MEDILIILAALWIAPVLIGLFFYGVAKAFSYENGAQPWAWAFWPFVGVGLAVFGFYSVGKRLFEALKKWLRNG